GARERPRVRDPGAGGGGAPGEVDPGRDADSPQRLPPAEEAAGLRSAGPGPGRGRGRGTERAPARDVNRHTVGREEVRDEEDTNAEEKTVRHGTLHGSGLQALPPRGAEAVP